MNSQLLNLARRIREMEGASPASRLSIPVTLPAVENIFPGRGLPGGSLVELLSTADGAGAWTLTLLFGKQVCGTRKSLIIADAKYCFYPPALCRLGIDLRRTLFLRSQRQDNLLAAMVQALQCPAVGAVIGRFETVEAAAY